MQSSNGSRDVCLASTCSEETGRRTSVTVDADHVGVHEETTVREFDATGQLRYERTERRSFVAPVTSVPADRFSPRPSPWALDAENAVSLHRPLAGSALPERTTFR